MDKLTFMRLWDLYHELLTPTQQELTNLYFNLDLTLSEIAEQKGISRQGVSECMAKCKKQLSEYEDKLHFSAALTEADLAYSLCVSSTQKQLQAFAAAHPEYREEIEKITSCLQQDHTKQAQQALAHK